MVKVDGASLDVKCPGGVLLKAVRQAWVDLMPDEMEDPESTPPLSLNGIGPDERLSPGKMLYLAPIGAAGALPSDAANHRNQS